MNPVPTSAVGCATGALCKVCSLARCLICVLVGTLLTALAVVLAVVLAFWLWESDAISCFKPDKYKSQFGNFRFAAVASDPPKCSQIGTKIMAVDHGNAVDAMVATIICGGLYNAQSSGIGGGALFVIYNRTTGQAISINGRETAPGFATKDMFVKNITESLYGGKAIAIPGELKGLWEIHQRYGTLPWASLLQPTIDLCFNGSELNDAQHESAVNKTDLIGNDPEFSFLYNTSSGTPVAYPVGHVIYRPKLGRTLQVIAEEGASAFYNGSLTDDIVQDLQDRGGNITREDLAYYWVNVSEPVTFQVPNKDITIHSAYLPGSGIIVEYLLNILSGYKFGPESVSSIPMSVLSYHRIIEAMKFAFAKRSELGDPNYVNNGDFLHDFSSPEVGAEIRDKITDDKTHDTDYYGPAFDSRDDTGTAHFAVVDSSGNAVSVTSTINTYFGSKVKGSRTGIIFNNQMNDFSTPGTANVFGVPASPAHYIHPGKRPMSSMSPTVIVDDLSGEALLVVGGAGGPRIITSVALVILRTLFFNETVMKAVDDPRLHHQLLPKDIQAEDDFPFTILHGLKLKGHKFTDMRKSVITAVHRTGDSTLNAVCDWRRGGSPDGY